jgi:hypothetical protein
VHTKRICARPGAGITAALLIVLFMHVNVSSQSITAWYHKLHAIHPRGGFVKAIFLQAVYQKLHSLYITMRIALTFARCTCDGLIHAESEHGVSSEGVSTRTTTANALDIKATIKYLSKQFLDSK